MILLTRTAIAAKALEMRDWMTGAGAMKKGENWIDEYWTLSRTSSMIGASRADEGKELQAQISPIDGSKVMVFTI